MRRLLGIVGGVIAAFVVATALPIGASQERGLRATLVGFDEVPAISTGAAGSFEARIPPGDEAIEWTLSYSGLEGNVTQSHIHVGVPRTNGGIAVWLCSNLASPPTPAGVEACPSPGGTVSGTITADNVVGPAGQGIDSKEFAELLRAIRSGAGYVNVHSNKFPGGEIRGQVE
jgi:hypothetical protein